MGIVLGGFSTTTKSKSKSSKSRPGIAVDGGWSTPQFCQTGTFVCGLMTRLHEVSESADTDTGILGGDSMGLTDLRAYCCKVAKKKVGSTSTTTSSTTSTTTTTTGIPMLGGFGGLLR